MLPPFYGRLRLRKPKVLEPTSALTQLGTASCQKVSILSCIFRIEPLSFSFSRCLITFQRVKNGTSEVWILGCPRRNLRDSKWKLGHIGKLPVIWLFKGLFYEIIPSQIVRSR